MGSFLNSVLSSMEFALSGMGLRDLRESLCNFDGKNTHIRDAL